MKSLSERIQAAQNELAAYAVPLTGTLGRVFHEPEDDTRFPFQRDRDRIIHTRAFRRLQGKTQVFVSGKGDHYRSRLTHTIEVVQISRDIARTMELNEDLTECIALAHDLGHPPFGHAGEDALNDWMKEHGLHFEHNEQSHRIVTKLAYHSALYVGLNLNREVLEGLRKHRTPFDRPEDKIPRPPSLEAQVVNLSDEIAYTGHDIDDGLRAGLFEIEDLLQIPLGSDAEDLRLERGTSMRGTIIHLLVSDLYEMSEHTLNSANIETLDDVYAATHPLITFSDDMRSKLDDLRSFLWENMYLHPSVLERSSEGKTIVTELCTTLFKKPSEKIIKLQKEHDASREEAVKDYVSGMTDAYATRMTGAQ